MWRWAEMFPGSENYYFAPYAVQAREIIWEPQRIQNMGPREWLLPGNQGIAESDMRLSFKNGSFIKIDGSDNFQRHRGTKPKGVTIYEEYKDFRPEFHQAYDPNRLANKSPLIILGTPPERLTAEHQSASGKIKPHPFIALADEFKADPEKRHFHMPSWANPKLDRTWLAKKKKELYAKGEGDVWEREYAAKRVPGGATKVFPMLDEGMVHPHDVLMKRLHRDRKKLLWYWFSDPGSGSCFATLFVAINPFTKEIFVLDETYELQQKEMTVGRMGPRIIKQRDELWAGGEWTQGYDEAALWFYNEFVELYEDEFLIPSQKTLHDKLAGLSLAKDVMLRNLLFISDRCVKFYWELDNYFKDKNGKLPKANDHLIDDFRYILGANGYSLLSEDDPADREKNDPDFRGARPEDDFDDPEFDGDDPREMLDTW